MEPDDDEHDGDDAIGPLLPPDDRIWRHPSELFAAGLAGSVGAVGVAAAPSRDSHTTWLVAVVSGLAGAFVVVSILAIGVALMTFPTIRQIGASLLASAGLAGLVVGMAMRPTLSNLLAGIQIALTQPIRLQDAVIVEGEWGWIEEITTTYVVVKIWDLRRLILPLTYFVEKPFQNWTRTTAMLLGSVYLYVDYSVPVDELRAELQRILKSTEMWLGEVCVLQVSDAREHTLELRALADAKDSGTAWDLRCLIREKLIAFIRDHYPHALSRARVELEPDRRGAVA